MESKDRSNTCWVLQIYINDETPVFLVNTGSNALHAQKRMHGSIRHKNLNEFLFPGSALTVADLHKSRLSVWNGYYDETTGEKQWISVDNLEDAINQGWLERATGTLVIG